MIRDQPNSLLTTVQRPLDASRHQRKDKLLLHQGLRALRGNYRKNEEIKINDE